MCECAKHMLRLRYHILLALLLLLECSCVLLWILPCLVCFLFCFLMYLYMHDVTFSSGILFKPTDIQTIIVRTLQFIIALNFTEIGTDKQNSLSNSAKKLPISPIRDDTYITQFCSFATKTRTCTGLNLIWNLVSACCWYEKLTKRQYWK